MPLRKMRMKLCVVGERAVGKTSLIHRYVRQAFDPVYTGTLGAPVYPLDVELPLDDGSTVFARITIFGMMGEHLIRDKFSGAIFHDADAVLAVCDIERPETLYALPDWIRSVSQVTDGVPFTIVFNKIDREAPAVGADEMSWLREQFPLVPTALTSARTGEGVETCFSGMIAETVGRKLAENRKRQADRLVRHRILSFIAKRGSLGASKGELFSQLKDVPAAEIMEELDHLVGLDLLTRDDSWPKSFVKSVALESTARFKATPLGEKVATSASLDELAVEEIR